MSRAARLVCLLACLAGCASFGERHYARLRAELRAGRGSQAICRIEAERERGYGRKQELLYWLDLAVAQAATGDRAASSESFERAKRLQRSLYTQRVTDHAEAVFLGDRALPYVAEPFEQVAMHLLEADNYLALGRTDEAAVELRAMDATLERCNRDAAAAQSVYRGDGAGAWLAGLLREGDRRELGHLSDARIDYERARATYERDDAAHFSTPVPRQLLDDLARVRAQLEPPAAGVARPPARAIVVLFDGAAPRKVEQAWEALVPPFQVLKVAYPAFVSDGRPPSSASVVDLQSGARAPFELASDFAEKARAHLAERMESIRSRAIARAVARATVTGSLQVAGALTDSPLSPLLEMVGFGLGLAGNALEQADTRSWQTLPARMSLASLPLAPGPFALEVRDGAERVLARFDGEVAAEGMVFRSLRML